MRLQAVSSALIITLSLVVFTQAVNSLNSTLSQLNTPKPIALIARN